MHLDERRGSEREHEKERVKEGSESRKEGRFQGEGRQAKRSSLREVAGSMSEWVDAKAVQEDLQSLGFTPSLAESEMEKEVGKRKTRL